MELSTEHPQGREQAGRRLLDGQVRLAKHAVARAFACQTVVLNLKTGTYHGLNPTAGRMLEVLGRSSSVRSAIDRLATEYEVPPDNLEPDVFDLVRDLLERDLVTAVDDRTD